jgi:hypothetical protein
MLIHAWREVNGYVQLGRLGLDSHQHVVGEASVAEVL